MTVEAVEEDRSASENTPGFLGYLLAVLLSWVLATLGMTVGLWMLGDGAGDRFGTWWDLQIAAELSLIVVTPTALLAGPIGVALVDFACDRFPQQWIHVLAAAVVAAGGASLAAWLLVGVPWGAPITTVGVALCAAVGRAAVIPMVPAVRRRKVAKQSVG